MKKIKQRGKMRNMREIRDIENIKEMGDIKR